MKKENLLKFHNKLISSHPFEPETHNPAALEAHLF